MVVESLLLYNIYVVSEVLNVGAVEDEDSAVYKFLVTERPEDQNGLSAWCRSLV